MPNKEVERLLPVFKNWLCFALTYQNTKGVVYPMARNRDKTGSLTYQIKQNLDSKLCIGQSKQMAKIAGIQRQGIYSWSTYQSYMKQLNYFAKYCKDKFNATTLKECWFYTDDWLQHEIERGISPYTIKLDVSALSKLYNCNSTDFIQTPSRHRANIERSRLDVVRDKNFSVEKNKPLVEFCKSTGLRRAELRVLTGDKLVERDGKYYIHVDRGSKGGRERYAPVVGDIENVKELMERAGTNRVFEKINSNADIHAYRSDYAVRVYQAAAREIRQLDRSERYYCRGDLKGVIYDRKAMLETSRALGHNRISVIAGHYLR